MPSHDPENFLRAFSSKLASRSRHVCVFLGAGSSRACGLPDVEQLRSLVLAKLSAPMREQFSTQLEGRNIEEALSRVRRISALLTGEQVLDGLSAESAEALDASVCQKIVDELDVTNANPRPARHFAVWAGRSIYSRPIEVFTVNYDLLLETAFDRHRVTYFDGFVGTLKAQFQTDLVEGFGDRIAAEVPSFFVRLWKLHGSVNWAWDSDRTVVRLGAPVSTGQAAAIYPSDMKYEESRRVPFLVLHDRLRRALSEPETLTIVSGYSFSDEHLNELIFDAVERRERSEVMVFCYGEIPTTLSDRALIYPNLQVVGAEEAIIGGARCDWVFPAETPSEFWSDGKFLLPDFSVLSLFLARSTGSLNARDPTLKDLLQAAAIALGDGGSP